MGAFAAGRHAVVDNPVVTEVNARTDEIRESVVDRSFGRDFLPVRGDEHRFVLHVGTGEEHAGLVGGVRSGERVVLDESGAENLILPVARLYVADFARLQSNGIGEQLVVRGIPVDLIGGVLAEIHHVVPPVHLLEPEVGVVLDFSAVAPASLGGDEDDAVGSAVAVDGRCGGVFQHLDRSDVVGVDHRKRGHAGVVPVDTAARGGADVEEGESIEHDQRGGGTGERVRASDEHVRLRAGFSGRGVDHQTGHPASQCIVDGEENAVFEGVGLNRSDGTGHVLFPQGAVPDHDDIADLEIGGRKYDVDSGALSDDFANLLVAEEVEYEYIFG